MASLQEAFDELKHDVNALIPCPSACAARFIHLCLQQHDLQSLTEMELRDEIKLLQGQLTTFSAPESGTCMPV